MVSGEKQEDGGRPSGWAQKVLQGGKLADRKESVVKRSKRRKPSERNEPTNWQTLRLPSRSEPAICRPYALLDPLGIFVESFAKSLRDVPTIFFFPSLTLSATSCITLKGEDRRYDLFFYLFFLFFFVFEGWNLTNPEKKFETN